jgi:hypothetical protein
MGKQASRGGLRALAVAGVGIALMPIARAAEFDVGDGKLVVTGSVFIGEALRTVKQDCGLVPSVNGALVGVNGCTIAPSAGKNQDDGNLNFNRGDPVTQVLKGYLTLDYRWRDYGVLASGKAWYDLLLTQGTFNWGNLPNGLTAGASLSDAGAQPRSKFQGIVADNLNVYGKNRIDETLLNWKVGYQKLDWGNRYVVFGGLRDLNPLDIPATLRPGVVREDETRIAFPALYASVDLPNRLRIEGFYQLHLQRNTPNECGTFFAQQDWISEGCDKVLLGAGSDRASLAAGQYIKRAPTPDTSNAGQGGIALKYLHEPWATEFGGYAVNFHSRASFYSAIKSLRPGPTPYLPGDPGGLNPLYFTEYPEDIQMYAATFDTKWRGGAVFGELSYRPNQPLNYNSADLITAFTSNTAPTPLRAQVNAIAAGGTFHGWERHDLLQMQVGATQNFPELLGASNLNVGAEVVYKNVPDLPDVNVTRFGRADVFGQGPVNGVCPAPQASIQCTNDGYVSKNAWGYRLRAALRYPNAVAGVDLIPSLFFGQDVSGWSGDGAILQGRYLAIASLRSSFGKGWTAELAWQPTWGGTYNNLRDRSVAQANVGYQF